MVSTGGFDAMVQVRRPFVMDLILRLLSDPSIRDQVPGRSTRRVQERCADE
jgi:hypothetical protein